VRGWMLLTIITSKEMDHVRGKTDHRYSEIKRKGVIIHIFECSHVSSFTVNFEYNDFYLTRKKKLTCDYLYA